MSDERADLIASYGDTAAWYQRAWSPIIRPGAQAMIAAMPIEEAALVLDVGCGVGSLIPDLTGRAPRATVAGADLTEAMLRRAHEAHPSVPLAVMDATRTGFADGVADGIVMAFMLFHIPEPLAALREARRVLRSGGAAGSVTWGTVDEVEAMRIFRDELDRAGAAEDPAAPPGYHELLDDPGKVEALYAEAGFSHVRAWVDEHAIPWARESVLQYFEGGWRRRRLETLEPSARPGVLERTIARIDQGGPDALVYRYTAVCAVATT